MASDDIIELYVFDRNVIENWYFQFMPHNLAEMLVDEPLIVGQHIMCFQHDGVLTGYWRDVREYTRSVGFTDLMKLDPFFWGHIKQLVYQVKSTQKSKYLKIPTIP